MIQFIFRRAMVFILLGSNLLLPEVLCQSQLSRYPNELPALKLYESGPWKSLEPYISTRQDVERVLGEPIQMYSESMERWTMGYEYRTDLPDWRIIVVYIGGGGSLPESLVGRVMNIRFEPKSAVSVKDVKFALTFLKGHSKDKLSGREFVTYDDSSGLHYSVYATDSMGETKHRRGDLRVVIYGASEEQTTKYSAKQ